MLAALALSCAAGLPEQGAALPRSAGAKSRSQRSLARSLGRTLAWSVLCLLATFAGRLTIMDGTSLSLVWPAAGITVLWFSMQRRARLRWVDPLMLAVITTVVNLATGATLILALWFVVANLLQVAVFLRVHARLSPQLWGAGGDAPLARSADLWRLLFATVAGTLAGAAIGPPAVWLVSGHVSWLDAAVWFTRNTVSILLIVAVGLRIGHHRRGGWQARRVPPLRLAEYAALIVCSISAYVVGFALNHGLPLAFPLLAVTVWAALRLHTPSWSCTTCAWAASPCSSRCTGTGRSP